MVLSTRLRLRYFHFQTLTFSVANSTMFQMLIVFLKTKRASENRIIKYASNLKMNRCKSPGLKKKHRGSKHYYQIF